jgi:hypothetical protein
LIVRRVPLHPGAQQTLFPSLLFRYWGHETDAAGDQVSLDALVRWFQLLCLTGPLALAEPKTLRWSLWHTPARIVHRGRRHIMRILDGWPTTDELLAAYQRVALIP